VFGEESILAFVAGSFYQKEDLPREGQSLGAARFLAADTRLGCEKARDYVAQSFLAEVGKDAAFAAVASVGIHATFESFDNRFHHFGALYKNLAILDLKEKKNELVQVRAVNTCL